jgi:hypothetical protein
MTVTSDVAGAETPLSVSTYRFAQTVPSGGQ